MAQQPQARRSQASTAALAARPGARWLPWALLALAVVMLAASLVIGLTGGEGWNAKLATIPVTLAFAGVGALIAARTGNRLGWLCLTAGTASAVTVVTGAYAERTPAAGLPGAAWAGWIFVVIVAITGPLFFLTPLLFPDGRLPSPRWRPVVWVAVAGGLTAMVCSAISDANFSTNFRRLRDPLVLTAPLGTAYNLGLLATLLALPAGVAAVIVRFRRAGQVERLQLKWFLFATAIAAAVVLAASELSNAPLPEFEIAFPLIPVAVGVAILKYRLYDIDRIISRTVSYAIVTGLLVGVYAGLVLLATQVFGFRTPVAVAASTLAAAALFAPVRARVQRVVDRRFNRIRYDADQTAAAFAARLRDAVDLATVRADLLAVVTKAVEPTHLSVWIAGDPGGGQPG